MRDPAHISVSNEKPKNSSGLSVVKIQNVAWRDACSPSKGVHRTWNKLLKKLIKQFEQEMLTGEAVA